jgi:molybdopterin-containing oxidoreductase family membrane subunit
MQTYRRLSDHSLPFWSLIFLHVAAVAAGLASALYMESNGHAVTGMNNQIVWGLPHVFAVFLIVAASGALNVASVSSVFHRLAYKPFARLSGILAIALLVGGLAVLVLDLGRPERVFVTLFHRNLKSIFAWNIWLYSGFVALVAGYLYAMIDRRVSKDPRATAAFGWAAFVWRLILTTGTGSIFGFLVARDAVSGAIMAPIFIASSLLYGLAFTVLVLLTMSIETSDILCTKELIAKFRGLLAIFAATTLALTLIAHLTKFYAAPTEAVELFLLRDGGIVSLAFWIGQIALGLLAPLALLAAMKSEAPAVAELAGASILFLFGGLAQMYVIIVGAQAWPLKIFPGLEASSAFGDGAIATYAPTAPEFLLGVSGVSLAMLLAALAFHLLPVIPQLQDKEAAQ